MFITSRIRWIGFDLDDTLHHFRQASTAAAEMVFTYVEEEFGNRISDLRRSYLQILRDSQSNHFVYSRTSKEYRTERFTRLLNEHSIVASGQIDHILNFYDDSLRQNLALTDGAESVLKAAKQKGFGIFIVSEGPHDAQVETLKRLGIDPYIDRIFTSAGEGLSKSAGLFEKTLKKLDLEPSEALFVGDSLERDIIPARMAGMQTAHLSSSDFTCGDVIQSLEVLTVAVNQARLRRPRNFMEERLKL